jgi:hypothetical protein
MHRFHSIADVLYGAGFERPSKKRILGALILNAPVDAGALEAAVKAYDRAVVRDCLVADAADDRVVQFPVRRPGPRRRPVS